MEDRRVGRVFREVRIRKAWRQRDLSDAAGVSQGLISRIELGRLGGLSLATLRKVGDALDIRISLDAWWQAGETFDGIWPARTAAVRRWLRRPSIPADGRRRGFGGIWFLPFERTGSIAASVRQVRRVRPPSPQA